MYIQVFCEALDAGFNEYEALYIMGNVQKKVFEPKAGGIVLAHSNKCQSTHFHFNRFLGLSWKAISTCNPKHDTRKFCNNDYINSDDIWIGKDKLQVVYDGDESKSYRGAFSKTIDVDTYTARQTFDVVDRIDFKKSCELWMSKRSVLFPS